MPENSQKGELERLIIYSYTSPDYSKNPVGEFKVAFNPTELTQVYDVEYDEQQGSGTTGSPMVFKRIKPQEYSLKFFFDGTGIIGDKIDVDERIKEFFEIVGYDGNIHRPRYLKLVWGTLLESRCILQKADINYKMFYPDGKPLRAVITATFKENTDDKTRVAKANNTSPDLTHIITVTGSSELPALAYEIYGDMSYYLELARVNKLNNFRRLKSGAKLFFPPVEKVKNG